MGELNVAGRSSLGSNVAGVRIPACRCYLSYLVMRNGQRTTTVQSLQDGSFHKPSRERSHREELLASRVMTSRRVPRRTYCMTTIGAPLRGIAAKFYPPADRQ